MHDAFGGNDFQPFN